MGGFHIKLCSSSDNRLFLCQYVHVYARDNVHVGLLLYRVNETGFSMYPCQYAENTIDFE